MSALCLSDCLFAGASGCHSMASTGRCTHKADATSRASHRRRRTKSTLQIRGHSKAHPLPPHPIPQRLRLIHELHAPALKLMNDATRCILRPVLSTGTSEGLPRHPLRHITPRRPHVPCYTCLRHTRPHTSPLHRSADGHLPPARLRLSLCAAAVRVALQHSQGCRPVTTPEHVTRNVLCVFGPDDPGLVCSW